MTLTATDRDALKRSIVMCRSESAARARQVDSMLASDRSWQSVAVFCCSCSQSRSLNLDPWQTVPFRAHLRDLNKPSTDPRGEYRAAVLLQKMLSLNLSPFEPDPVAAIEPAEAQRQSAPAK